MESTVMGVHERRSGLERRSGDDRRLIDAADTVIGDMEKEAMFGANRTWRSVIEIIGYVVAAALGLFIYKVTGLYDATDSSPVRVGLGAIIALWFVLNVRVALNMK